MPESYEKVVRGPKKVIYSVKENVHRQRMSSITHG